MTGCCGLGSPRAMLRASFLPEGVRLSVRDFADRLGIGVRTVSKWEARQADVTPLPHMQEVLDTALTRASDEAKARFANTVLRKQYDELTTAKHQYVTSQSESSRANHREHVDRNQSIFAHLCGSALTGSPCRSGGDRQRRRARSEPV